MEERTDDRGKHRHLSHQSAPRPAALSPPGQVSLVPLVLRSQAPPPPAARSHRRVGDVRQRTPGRLHQAQRGLICGRQERFSQSDSFLLWTGNVLAPLVPKTPVSFSPPNLCMALMALVRASLVCSWPLTGSGGGR